MNEELTVNPIDFGIEVTKGSEIQKSFMPKITEREVLAKVYENIIGKEMNEELAKEARDCRLKLVKVRTGIADIHKVEKQFYLQAGKFVDALKNKHTLPVEQMESKMKEIEDFYENIEKQKIETLKNERLEILIPLGFMAEHGANLGSMEEDTFGAIKLGLETAKEAKEKAEKKAEQERLDAIESERVRVEAQAKENAKLKAEAEAREKSLAEEREKAAKERAESDAKLKAEAEAREKSLAEEREKAAKERAESDAKLKAEREAREKIEAQIKAKADAEEKSIKEAKAQSDKAAKAPDKEKLSNWVNAMSIGEINVKDASLDLVAKEIESKFNSFKAWAINQINQK